MEICILVLPIRFTIFLIFAHLLIPQSFFSSPIFVYSMCSFSHNKNHLTFVLQIYPIIGRRKFVHLSAAFNFNLCGRVVWFIAWYSLSLYFGEYLRHLKFFFQSCFSYTSYGKISSLFTNFGLAPIMTVYRRIELGIVFLIFTTLDKLFILVIQWWTIHLPVQETWLHSLEEVGTHSSILAWKVPWTERGAWQSIVHEVTKELHMTQWLNINKGVCFHPQQSCYKGQMRESKIFSPSYILWIMNL